MADQLEEQVGGVGLERQVTEFIDDEQSGLLVFELTAGVALERVGPRAPGLK